MSITFRLRSRKHPLHRCRVEFNRRSPWDDIPLERAILGLAVDGTLPAPADWQSTPGSDAGLSAYRSFLHLHRRWVDARPPSVDHSFRNYLDKPWKAVTSAGEGERSLAVRDAERVLGVFLAAAEENRTAFAVERSLAYGLTALCALVSGETWLERRTVPTPPGASEPIRYLTAYLEGFSTLRRVAVDTDGHAVWVEFLSGSKYRIPAEFLRRWARSIVNVSSPVRAARVADKKRHLRVSFGPGEEYDFGAETILLNCEPRYRADDERDSQREFLAEGLTRYGYLGRDRWKEASHARETSD